MAINRALYALVVTIVLSAVASPVQAADTAPILLSRNLQLGSTGTDVGLLQQFLSTEGYFSLSTTTYFGKQTKAAVIAFQRAVGINPIGIAGPVTRLAIAERTMRKASASSTPTYTWKVVGSVGGSHRRRDSQPPSAPTGLAVMQKEIGGLTIEWVASTDNISDTLRYSVERCSGVGCNSFVSIGTVTSASYRDTDIVADTVYSYRVRAYDVAGNASAYSSSLDSVLALATLTTSKTGSGGGTITSSPAGISCGSDCVEILAADTMVTLTATPNADSNFTGWSGGGCSGTGACVVTLHEAATVTATFALKTYALTVTKTGTGTGTVISSPSGISCGATCSYSYDTGTVVTLTATAGTGIFVGWSGSGCSGTGACVVTVDAIKSVTATFSTLFEA